ncbi:MAG: aldo/keto reductase [Thermoprotei archaeon]|jgi:aryl-alcohol dehydrogenase-like predicted oxidoreductase
MNYRRVANTKIEVSEIGVGIWSIITNWWGSDINKAEDLLKKAYDLGINFYDTADMYADGKGEEILAKVFSSKRDKIIILTKVGYDFYNKKDEKIQQNFSIDYLNFAVIQSLKRLNTDYIDILMLHNPKMNTIKDQTIRDFLMQLKKDSIVRLIGVALGPTLGWKEEGLESIRQGYESLEYIYNIIEQQPGIDFLSFHSSNQIGHFIRVPRASDALLESKWPITYDPKLHRSLKDINWINKAVENSKELLKFAKSKNMKLSQLAIKFVLSEKKVTSVIPNISNLNELEEFVQAADYPDLSIDDLTFINNYYKQYYRQLNEESINETMKFK